ncbi:hypothetical protein VTK73DRAFT_767 [Phialemonium thermophilum]|uniref:dolichyl-phosphate beta-glucosyltransferase n=1 Tax=Phialemonium thermophilum TaxID=223376 RepID=A0ABR3XCZ2_9PEZI
MDGVWDFFQTLLWAPLGFASETPLHTLILVTITVVTSLALTVYVVLHLIAPKPRAVLPSEKTYVTTNPDGTVSSPRPLPCWYDRWFAERHLHEKDDPSAAVPKGFHVPDTGGEIEPAEVEISVIIPAYNEEDRILPTLEEMVDYLDERFGRPQPAAGKGGSENGTNKTSPPVPRHRLVFKGDRRRAPVTARGYEILIVDDGSRDRTAHVALEFAARRGLHDVLRVIRLERNRGKGGGVTHGFRHARGAYVLFADADGASRFSDLGKLVEGCEDVVDGSGRGVAIGSRAHLVGSEAVVKRSAIRNFLMRSFHFVLMILTPPATSRIRDTQCGFKLFSRAALPHIVPYMHTEGWIFDIEMLMLAESAPATPVLASDGAVIGTTYGIRVAEIPVEWHEVGGSKMSLVRDSVKMALGLAVLRASWMLGVYRRRLT